MSNNGSTFLGIVAGTALGAALGILFAPDKGSNTRQRIADEAQATKDKLAEKAGALKEQITNTANSRRKDINEEIESIVSDASYKADDVISALESKLKTLKEKNKRLQKTS